MKITITGRKMVIKDSLKEKVGKKLSKLDKFFGEDAEAQITFTENKNMITLEVTIVDKGMIYRAEKLGMDALACIDEVVDVLIRQIRKNKTRLEKKLRANAFAGFVPNETEAEEEYKLIRTKKVSVKPMDVEEAILQMNMIGHQFFMFVNADTEKVSIVYKRNDGNYALLEPENA